MSSDKFSEQIKVTTCWESLLMFLCGQASHTLHCYFITTILLHKWFIWMYTNTIDNC